MNDREKLKHLIEHWIEHNQEHRSEFLTWAERAGDIGEALVHSDILEASEKLQEATEALLKASERLND